jgi:hypothetical protein
MKGMNAIREKRGIQWNRSQISVPTGPLYLFFIITLAELYSVLKNIVVTECLNA